MMFRVDLDDVAIIQRGQCAVVVSNVGEEPEHVKKMMQDTAKLEAGMLERGEQLTDAVRPESGVERYVVPKGYRGIQQDVAGPGIYYLNRRAFIAYVIDTTNITIDWDENSDTKFDPLKVVSRDGFEISVSVKVIIRVRPDQAPYMVSKIGSIDNLIQHVIHPMIDSSFRNQASSTSAMNFLQDRQEEQRKAEERARIELEKYHVECVSVLICQIRLPQELMDTQTMKIIAQQQLGMYQEQQKAEQTRIATEKTRSEAEMQKSLVEAEIGVKIAEQTKQKTIRAAEGEAESIRIRAEGEAKGIKAIGELRRIAGVSRCESRVAPPNPGKCFAHPTTPCVARPVRNPRAYFTTPVTVAAAALVPITSADSGSPRSTTGASVGLKPNAFTACATSSPCSRANSWGAPSFLGF